MFRTTPVRWFSSLSRVHAAQSPLKNEVKSKIQSSSLPFHYKSTKIDSKSSHANHEKVVLWKLYGAFHKHNTLASLVAVVEDPDFMDKNQHLSYNDKVLYYMQLPHHPKILISAGQLGFKKAQRQEYEAAFQVASKLFKTIEDKNLIGPNDKIELILKDFGKGREAFLAALQGKEGSGIKGNIVRIYDNTTLKFGGVRSKKLRRL